MNLLKLFGRQPPAAKKVVVMPLPRLLMDAVQTMSEEERDIDVDCGVLAARLNAQNADCAEVRAILADVVYDGDSDNAEKLMNLLARHGFGNGALTVRQPDIVTAAQSEPTSLSAPEPGIAPAPSLCSENLFYELAVSSDAYAAVLLGDSGTGLTTLMQRLIGAALTHPCSGVTITVLDFVGEPDWKGLAAVPNTLAVLSSRDPKFLELAADYVGQVAKEIQQRHAQRTIRQRSPSLGSSQWPLYVFALNGWQTVAEVLEIMTPTQLQQHPHAAQLLADFRYCLASGPKVNVTVICSGDRIENMGLSQTALDTARLFALGAVHQPGRGGYRAVDALLTNKHRIPDLKERKALSSLLRQCKATGISVVLALSGTPRLGQLKDFRDNRLNLGELYRTRKGA
ncbi:MAG: hypothetical protein AAFQ63_15705 [Cyanobacteria bacterium J06621_11]